MGQCALEKNRVDGVVIILFVFRGNIVYFGFDILKFGHMSRCDLVQNRVDGITFLKIKFKEHNIQKIKTYV